MSQHKITITRTRPGTTKEGYVIKGLQPGKRRVFDLLMKYRETAQVHNVIRIALELDFTAEVVYQHRKVVRFHFKRTVKASNTGAALLKAVAKATWPEDPRATWTATYWDSAHRGTWQANNARASWVVDPVLLGQQNLVFQDQIDPDLLGEVAVEVEGLKDGVSPKIAMVTWRECEWEGADGRRCTRGRWWEANAMSPNPRKKGPWHVLGDQDPDSWSCPQWQHRKKKNN